MCVGVACRDGSSGGSIVGERGSAWGVGLVRRGEGEGWEVADGKGGRRNR
jgi:hypothetical protein